MRIVSLLGPDGTFLRPESNVFVGRAGLSSATKLLITNVSQPDRLPIASDTIEIRHLDTNRLVGFDVTRDVLWLSSEQRDHKQERTTLLVRVHSASTRTRDGLLVWEIGPMYDGVEPKRMTLMALEQSLGATLDLRDGTSVARSSEALVAGPRGDADLVCFHPLEPDNIMELRTGQMVWLTVGGARVVTESAGDRVRLRARAIPETNLETSTIRGELFEISPAGTEGILSPGARFRLRTTTRGQPPLWVAARGGELVLERDAADHDRTAVFTLDQLRNLDGYWNAEAQDNALAVGPVSAGFAASYRPVRTEGCVLVAPRYGTVPLKQFYSSARRDTLTTATIAGQEAALDAGYAFRGVIGWAYREPQRNTRVARTYYHPGRQDTFFTATGVGERSARAGYTFRYDECYVLPPLSVAVLVTPGAPVVTKPVQDEPQGPTMPTLAIDPSKLRNVVGPGIVTGRIPAPALRPEVGNKDLTLAAGRVLETERRVPGQVLTKPPVLRRTVKALVLSGGGAKGAFEAGAIQALWNQGYRPDIICGVSVGAVNAVKLAEYEEHSADGLVDLWRQFSRDPEGIYLKNFYLDLLRRAADAVAGAATDTALATLIAKIAMSLVAPGAFGMDFKAGIGVGMIAAETSDLSDHLRRVLNLAVMSHAMHSMEPLRRLLDELVSTEKIAEKGPRLRLGITDARTGCYFTVGEPLTRENSELRDYGLVELEPDMAEGGNWLTSPVFGLDGYAMRIKDAVYASSIMPVFMEPYRTELGSPRVVAHDGLDLGLLDAGLPESARVLIEAATREGRRALGRDFSPVQRAIDDYGNRRGFPADTTARDKEIRKRARLAGDGARGMASNERVLFDGGLVDSIPIRTAIRMGATEILVIGVDNLGRGGASITSPEPITQYSWLKNLLGNDGVLGGIDAGALSALQYLFATLAGFVHGSTRNDMLASLGVIDQRRLGGLALEHMPEGERERFTQTVQENFETQARRRRSTLGGATALGGFGHDDYGPPTRGDIAVDVILPQRPLLDSLGFDDHAGVEEAIELGRLAARDIVSV